MRPGDNKRTAGVFARNPDTGDARWFYLWSPHDLIAAGTLPTTRGNLAGWVTDAQSIKPGVRMPSNPLAPDELQALLDYLESLK